MAVAEDLCYLIITPHLVMAVAEDLGQLETAAERAQQRPLLDAEAARAVGGVRGGLRQRGGEGACG